MYVSVVRITLDVCLSRGHNFESFSNNWLVSCYCRCTGYFTISMWNWPLFCATQRWRQSQLLKCFHPLVRIKLNFSVMEVYFISLSWASNERWKCVLVARSVLNESAVGEHKSLYLQLIEELCREGDRLLEETRKERDDLQQQVRIFLNSTSV
jgi:hypothetical protein